MLYKYSVKRLGPKGILSSKELKQQFDEKYKIDLKYFENKYYQPNLPFKLTNKLLSFANTSMDISDGLSSEVMHLCKASKVGVSIYEDKLPIDQQTFDRARDNHLDPTTCALNGGEDYELVFAVDLADYDKIKHHPMFTIVGHFVEESEGYTLTAKDGSNHLLEAQGWNPIKE